MKIYIKYDINVACRTILQEQLEKLGIHFDMNESGEIQVLEVISLEDNIQLQANLKRYGIDILSDQKSQLIQRIKNVILDAIG